MGLIRRDNPALPDDYYVSSFVAGLQEYTQHHLQFHKPRDIQEAMWMARRIEQSNPVKKFAYHNQPYQHRRDTLASKDQQTVQPTNPTVNQQF